MKKNTLVSTYIHQLSETSHKKTCQMPIMVSCAPFTDLKKKPSPLPRRTQERLDKGEHIRPRCAFCVSSGLSIPTDHAMNDSSGRVVCGRLLATQCKVCHLFGHTTKYCSVRKFEEQRQKDTKRREIIEQRDLGNIWVDAEKTVSVKEKSGEPQESTLGSGSRFAYLCQEVEDTGENAGDVVQDVVQDVAEKKPKRVTWTMSIIVTDQPKRASKGNVMLLNDIKWKQTTNPHLKMVNLKWEQMFVSEPKIPPCLVTTSRWSDVSLEDQEELPDVHDMFAAEAKRRANLSARYADSIFAC